MLRHVTLVLLLTCTATAVILRRYIVNQRGRWQTKEYMLHLVLLVVSASRQGPTIITNSR